MANDGKIRKDVSKNILFVVKFVKETHLYLIKNSRVTNNTIEYFDLFLFNVEFSYDYL